MYTKKDLLIIGAGGFSKEVAWIVERINECIPCWNLLGFIDNEKEKGIIINGYKVLGNDDIIADYPDAYYICAIGASKVRRSVINKIKRAYPNIKFAKIIDPSAEISNLVDIGAGTIICAHTIITVNVSIGEHVIINMDCTIGHDAVLKDFDTLYPSVNISGMTTVGECTELGTGTQLIQGKAISSNTIVGAGAVIVKDLVEAGTYVGVPTIKIK